MDKILNENDFNIYLQCKKINNTDGMREMSIFSKRGSYHIINGYKYFKTDETTKIYYINLDYAAIYNKPAMYCKLFFDCDKKIFFDSFLFTIHFPTFEGQIKNILLNLTNIDINTCNMTHELKNISNIQSWFTTYGHFLDEVTNLYSFSKLIASQEETNITPIIDYSDNRIRNPHITDNYDIICNALFDDEFEYINPSSPTNGILCFNSGYLVEHKIISPNFHIFPIDSTNKIKNKLTNEDINEGINNKIFITRSDNIRNYRNLKDKNIIENILHEKGYEIVNPENITLSQFISILKNKNEIILTWGSAITNLIFCNSKSNITILKSESYDHESIELFRKMINLYQLNYTIISEKQDNLIERIQNIL